MTRPFPIQTDTANIPYPGLIDVTYDISDSVYNLLEDNTINLGSYPDGMFWGGISKNDCPYMYSGLATFDSGSKVLSIRRMINGTIQDASYEDAQISYAYIMQSVYTPQGDATFKRDTNWRVSSPILDWSTYKSNLANGVMDTFNSGYFCTRTPINRTCPLVYALVVRKDSWNALPQTFNSSLLNPQDMIKAISIRDIEDNTAIYIDPYTNTTYSNLGASDFLFVGFNIQEYGSITGFTNTDEVYMHGTVELHKGLLPMNALFANYAKSIHNAAFGNVHSRVFIPSKHSIDADLMQYPYISPTETQAYYNYLCNVFCHYVGTFGGFMSNGTWMQSPYSAALNFMYMGDADIDLSITCALEESGGLGFDAYVRHYSAGDKYLVCTTPARLPGSTGFDYNQVQLWPIFEDLDALYKYIAGFGSAFLIGTKYAGLHTFANGIYNPDLFAPVLDDHNIYHGEYTRGASENPRNRFFDIESNLDTDYEPSDDPEPVPRDEGENIGDSISRPGSLGIGGTNDFITQYSMTASQIAELGNVLWTSVFTADYWKNFMFSLALDTGSINVSAILNFFISLRVYPFSLANLDSYTNIGQDMYIGSGMMPLHFSNALYTIDEYAEYINGGKATIWSNNFFGDWRDYVNTQITLYIPYCGTVQLNPSDVVGNEISVQYAIDFATGACIAYVDLKTGDGAGYPIAALPGQIGADIPLTATAAGQVAARLAADAMNVAGLIGDTASREIGTVTGALSGNFAPTAGSVGFLLGGPLGAAAGISLGSVPGAAGAAMGMLSHSGVQAPMLGGARGFASFGAPQTPYVQIRRGIYPTIPNYNDVVGKPAPESPLISECTGFIKGDVITAGLAVQAEEAEAIRAAISNGIIV